MNNEFFEHLNGDQQLPRYYDENNIALLPRDPYWLFTYWEIKAETKNEIERKENKAWPEIPKSLAFNRYNATGQYVESSSYFSLANNEVLTGSWYYQGGVADRKYFVELGYLDRQNQFQSLLSSNEVITPRDSLSDIIDERWRLPDWQARSLFWRVPKDFLGYNQQFTRKLPKISSFKTSKRQKRLLGKEGS